MALTFSALAVNAKADAQAALLDGGTLELFDGRTCVARLHFASPAFAAAVDGLATAHPLKPDASLRASGTATRFQAKTRGGAVVCAGSVGTSGADLVLNRTTFDLGDTAIVTTFTLQEPMA